MKELLKKIDFTFYDLLLQNKAVLRIIMQQTGRSGQQAKTAWYDYKRQCFSTVSSSTKFYGQDRALNGVGSYSDAFHIYKWLSSYLNVGIEVEVKNGGANVKAVIHPLREDFLYCNVDEIDATVREKLSPLKLKVCNKEFNSIE